MSRVAAEIIYAYPALETGVRTLTTQQASDLQLMAALATHVVDLFQAGHDEEVAPAFAMAERLIVHGSEVERQAADLGFLETIQNVASHRSCGASAFERFLGPRSQQAWGELLKVWKGKTSLAEVVAAETGAQLNRPWWQFWRKRHRPTPDDLLSQVENPELRRIIEQITRK